jgi:hypothetical protein
VYRRSLFLTEPLEELLLREEAVRRDSAVHVSLSSYSLVKQPGTLAIPLFGEPKSRRS